jgi:hypothetical protein
MFRLSSQACEYFDMSDDELFRSDVWNDFLLWLKETHQVPSWDIESGESINYALVEEFARSSGFQKKGCDYAV